MKQLLRFEEFTQLLLVLGILIFVIDASWWWYLILLFGPDISMLGYLVSSKIGTILYNVFHHKSTALIIFGFAFLYTDLVFSAENLLFTLSFALYGHSSMDRIFGYGLKHFDSFNHTHLGKIGMLEKNEV